MPYCSPDDLIDLFGQPEMIQLTNLDNPGSNFVRSERIESAIVFADSTIDSYLSAQIPLPLPSAPLPPNTDNYATLRQILRGKSIDISRYILESRGEPRPDVKIRYDLALEWLRMVSTGEIELKSSTTTADPSSMDGMILYGGEKRVFTRKSMQGYTDTWTRSTSNREN